jgi:hypothetical protein
MFVDRKVGHVGHGRSDAWPRKSVLHRCDYCGSQLGDLNAWDWPPDNPSRTVWLHPRCEAPWYDSNGLPEGVQMVADNGVSR